jgi:hypothetical protein
MTYIYNFKNAKGVLFMFLLMLLPSLSGIAQVYYSTFSSPVNGTDYSYSTSGLCLGCSVSNPSNSASLGKSDSTKVIVSIGLLNSTRFRMRLTDTANSTASVIFKDNNGVFNLGGLTIKTYLNGSLVETFTSISMTAIVISGSKREVQVPASLQYNEVEITFSGVLSLSWNVYLYYAKGLVSNPLPVKFISTEANMLNEDVTEITWTVDNDPSVSEFKLYGSTDGMANVLLGTMQASPGCELTTTYKMEITNTYAMYNSFVIVATHLYGKDISSDIFYLNKNVAQTGTHLLLYPNPAVNVLNVLPSQQAVSVEVYNEHMTRLLFLNPATDRMDNIDISGWSAGKYFVTTYYKNGKTESKSFVRLQ